MVARLRWAGAHNNHETQHVWQWLTAEKYYVHFLTKLRFWYRPSIFLSLRKCDILTHYRNEEKLLEWRISSNWSGCAKVLCPLHSVAEMTRTYTQIQTITADLASDKTHTSIAYAGKQVYLSSYKWRCAAPHEEISWVVDVVKTKHIKHVTCYT